MTSRNIHYQSAAIERYYSNERIAWDQFYESERTVLSRLDLGPGTRVLDLGCGCGGLGLALRDRFGVSDYTGVDINPQAVSTAKGINPAACFLSADILDVTPQELREESYDLVVSLSCIDWNVEFDRMLQRAFRYVKEGGVFLASFRLTDGMGVTDLRQSYQFINFAGKREGEKAPYVVLNARDLLKRLTALQPEKVIGYGYWGSPSNTAVTLFERICFAVFAVRKNAGGKPCAYDIDLPEDIKPLLMAGSA